MTALIYKLSHEEILIAMDTLSISQDDKSPLSYVTKFTILPHLRSVIAGTGDASLISNWFKFVNWDLNVQTIEQLNDITPNILQREWRESCGNIPSSATLFHFGYSEKSKVHIGYRYSSRDNFVSQQLPYTFGYKPGVPESLFNDLRKSGGGVENLMLNLMIEQQKSDNELAIAEKVGIGGEICLIIIKGNTISTLPIYRFESYDSDLALMPQQFSE